MSNFPPENLLAMPVMTLLGATKRVRYWGGQWQFTKALAGIGIAELQWRGGASEPDPFATDMRLTSANAGGTWWTLTPALSYKVSARISVLGGIRIPIHSDVTGNQLVPSIGGFLALSATWPLAKKKAGDQETPKPSNAKVAIPAPPKPKVGTITVVDYWATWCAPCKKIDAALTAAEPGWPDVKIERIDASGWPDSGVQLPDGAQGLPIIAIFDATGKRRYLLKGSEALKVVEYVNTLRAELPPTQSSGQP